MILKTLTLLLPESDLFEIRVGENVNRRQIPPVLFSVILFFRSLFTKCTSSIALHESRRGKDMSFFTTYFAISPSNEPGSTESLGMHFSK